MPANARARPLRPSAVSTDALTRLQTAANLIDAAMQDLDHSTSRCGCCGLMKRQNLTQCLAWEHLQAVAKRIRKIREELINQRAAHLAAVADEGVEPPEEES